MTYIGIDPGKNGTPTALYYPTEYSRTILQ